MSGQRDHVMDATPGCKGFGVRSDDGVPMKEVYTSNSCNWKA